MKDPRQVVLSHPGTKPDSCAAWGIEVLLQVLGKELPSPFFLQDQNPNCGFTGPVVDRLRNEFHLAATDEYFDEDFDRMKRAILPEIALGRVALLAFPVAVNYSTAAKKNVVATHVYVVTGRGASLTFLTREGGNPMQEASEEEMADRHTAWRPWLENPLLRPVPNSASPKKYLLHTLFARPLYSRL